MKLLLLFVAFGSLGALPFGCIRRSDSESGTPTTPSVGGQPKQSEATQHTTGHPNKAKALANALNPKNLVLTTAAGSPKRILALGLALKGSEDVSAMLVKPKRPLASTSLAPNEAIEWVIDVRVSQLTTRATALTAFSPEWRKAHFYPEIYGRSVKDKAWTTVRASDSPPTYDRLAVGVPLNAGARPMTVEALNKVLAAVITASKSFGGACKARSDAKDAANTSEKIFALVRRYEDEKAEFVLDGNGKMLAGKAIWDTMMSLGLEWGDMDLFHWENTPNNRGHQHLFSVASSNGMGNFFPEQIAAGKHRSKYLLFEFSVARSIDPVGVFDNMLKAAKYAQKRLGGVLEDTDEKKLDAQAIRKRLKKITDEMTSAGFPPGAAHTMMVF